MGRLGIRRALSCNAHHARETASTRVASLGIFQYRDGVGWEVREGGQGGGQGGGKGILRRSNGGATNDGVSLRHNQNGTRLMRVQHTTYNPSWARSKCQKKHRSCSCLSPTM